MLGFMKSLRLNGLLAVLIQVKAGALICIGFGHWHHQLQQNMEVNHTKLTLRPYIAGLSGPALHQGDEDFLSALKSMEHHWVGLAKLTNDGEGGIDELRRIGDLSIDHELIPPQLTWAVAVPQSWRLGPQRVAMAAPWLNPNGTIAAVIYGEAMHTYHDGLLWFYLFGLDFFALGGGLDLYFVRRMYLPVKDLTEPAKAAMHGEALPARHTSVETNELSAAISQLRASVSPRKSDVAKSS
jgi:hypothetical protein